MDYLALRKDLQSSALSSNLKDAPPPSPAPRSSTLPATTSSSASASRNYSSSYEATATSSTLTQSRDYGSLGGGRGDSFDVLPPK